MPETNTVVVGAGPAGLAVAACLRRRGVPYVLLEKADRAGVTWRNHYDRLHLHTDRSHSALPYLPMPSSYPRYPSRDQFVAYLEEYVRFHQLEPRLLQTVTRIAQEDGGWVVETQDARYRCANVVVATGYTREPVKPAVPGVETYRGTMLHSSAYRNGADLRGKSVLVVGFGNSGGEIAIDLVEHGAHPTLAVRGEVNVIPRDLMGLPILSIALLMAKLPPALADILSAPLLRLAIGSLAPLGLKQAPYGPFRQIRNRSRIPLLDIGTIKLIRKGLIKVKPGVAGLSPTGATFADGTQADFDAVIWATGYRPAVGAFLADVPGVLTADGTPLTSGRESACPGLFFCGYYVAATGMLREIGLEARRIAGVIAGRGRS